MNKTKFKELTNSTINTFKEGLRIFEDDSSLEFIFHTFALEIKCKLIANVITQAIIPVHTQLFQLLGDAWSKIACDVLNEEERSRFRLKITKVSNNKFEVVNSLEIDDLLNSIKEE